MPQHRRPYRSLEELHEAELSVLMRMPQRELGIAAAMHYCAKHRLVPPPELVCAAATVFCELLRREKPQKRGRAAGTLARYRQDMIDYTRADQVRVVREKQQEIARQVEELKQLNAPPHLMKEQKKTHDWVGTDWLRVYACVSAMLRDTDAFGGPEAVKASYLRYLQNSKNEHPRYKILDSAFLRELGLDCSFPNRDRKVRALYDLPL